MPPGAPTGAGHPSIVALYRTTTNSWSRPPPPAAVTQGGDRDLDAEEFVDPLPPGWVDPTPEKYKERLRRATEKNINYVTKKVGSGLL